MRQQHEQERARGGDVVMDLDVTLEELYSGNFIEVIGVVLSVGKSFEFAFLNSVCSDQPVHMLHETWMRTF